MQLDRHDRKNRRRAIWLALLIIATLMIGSWPQGESHADGTRFAGLNPSTDGIHLGLSFNWNIDPQKHSMESGKIDFVYGAVQVGTQPVDNPATNVVHTYYIALGKSNNFNEGLAPYLDNHPDWIVYTYDRKTPAWYIDKERPPLDLTNPAVRAYMCNTWLIPAVTTGHYQGVVFDQGETLNLAGRVGHYRTTTTLAAPAAAGATTIQTATSIPAGTWISFGTSADAEYFQVTAVTGSGPYTLTLSGALAYAHQANEWVGTWVRQFTGKVLDVAFRRAQIAAFADIAARIHAANPTALIAINNLLRNYLAGTDQSGATAADYWFDLLPYVDVEIEECGFTNCANGQLGSDYRTGSNWMLFMQDLRAAQQQGKAVFIINYEPYTVTSNMTTTDSQARADLQWVAANYLLIKGNYTYMTWRGPSPTQVKNEIYWQPEYNAPIGHPTDDMYQSQNVWMRDYSNGLAIANPSASTYTITLPVGYQDLYGNAVTTATMPSHSGLILLGRPSVPPPATVAPTADVVTNGGFENGVAPWQTTSAHGNPIVDTALPHTGSYSADLCGYTSCLDNITQIVTLPKAFTGATFSYWYDVVANRAGSGCADQFTARIIDPATNNVIKEFQNTCNISATGWQQFSQGVTAALQSYAGKQVELFFQGTTNSTTTSHLYVDDVSLKLTGITGGATVAP